MQFFVDEKQRSASQSTCYLEFQKGYFSGKCWQANSINIGGELWDKYHLSNLIFSVVRNFDYYGITEVTKNQWNQIILSGRESGELGYNVLKEAELWVNECFKEYDVFTIVGI